MNVAASAERRHSLDAVRALALLAGIVLHATMSFVPGFALSAPRTSLDVSPSATLAVLFFAIHVFRMSLFFVIAGFFARALVVRDGARAFIANRRKRVLVPLLLAYVTIGPLVIAAVLYQAVVLYGSLAAAPPLPGAGVPLLHFWFLYYLLWLYAAALAVRALTAFVPDAASRAATALDAALPALVRFELAPVVFGLPLAASLYLLPSWDPWTGIPTPDRGLVPKLVPLLAFGSAFAVGWFVHRRPDVLVLLKRRAAWHLGVAVALTLACLALVGPTYAGAAPLAERDWARAAYALGYTAALWYWSFGCIGVAERYWARPSPLARYLADSSYWLYLAHLPLVFFLAGLVAEIELHWSVKFPAILAVAVALLLLSYHYWVRPTFIGALLNGRRVARAAARKAA